MKLIHFAAPLAFFLVSVLHAHDLAELDELVVLGKAESLIGVAGTASKGQASADELMGRPYLRRGELLEMVPGVIITQHSGDGKANQYFVRGYNLDHGTDYSISMDGQPVNFVTHAHGQGYADLNPLIPELVESIDYWKGPFHAHLGDLSTAGATRFNYVDTLPSGIARLGMGQHNFLQGLMADTISLGQKQANGDFSALTYAAEYNYYDGPWQREGNSQRMNGFLKYYRHSGRDQFSISAMAYDAVWDSTDQIPKRLIEAGGIHRLGNLDNTVGGESSRYSLMAEWERDEANGKTHVDVYLGSYELDLFSNFTYFLDDPVTVNGDQFEQQDGRWFMGGEVRREWDYGNESLLTVGMQTRHDLLDDIGLYRTTARMRNSTDRVDDVYQGSLGIYASANHVINDWLRLQPGLRADGFHFDVKSDDALNSGKENAAIVSPKLNLIFGPWAETELYASAGMGFHSNDARGVNMAVDAADPLVRTYGYELGVRTEALDQVVSTLALFYLHSDSEILYVGDAGTAEAGPATDRYGIEWTTYWRPNDWMMFDHELTLSEAKLLNEPAGNEIPGSVPLTMSSGFVIGKDEGLFTSVRSRFFDARPLTEDGSVESRVSWQVNGRLGYRKNDWELALEVLNILGRDDNDIEYYYESQLAGEPTGVEDVHLHPTEPRTFRVSLTKRF